MKLRFGCIALVLICLIPVASAQETRQKTKLANISVGIDFGGPLGGFSSEHGYTNNGPIEKSGTDYAGSNAFGGTLRFNEGKGYLIEGRARHQALGDPADWILYANQRPTRESFGGKVTGNYLAADIMQQIPLFLNKTRPHGISLAVTAGVSQVRAVIGTVYDDRSNPFYDKEKLTYSFLGPKGGGKIGYTGKRFTLNTEFTLGYLRERGTYNDLQGQYTASGITYFPPFTVRGKTWSRETNWRSSLAVPIASHLAVRATYERKVNYTSDGDFILHMAAADGVGVSTSFKSSTTMVGLVFHL